mmetsp:Transcript_13570/g.51806  ORF Transcript_13570/g.51806 Transcript_13570/m.51806 type:complete len:244 (+) Transcript_13570:630-1361(+)
MGGATRGWSGPASPSRCEAFTIAAVTSSTFSVWGLLRAEEAAEAGSTRRVTRTSRLCCVRQCRARRSARAKLLLQTEHEKRRMLKCTTSRWERRLCLDEKTRPQMSQSNGPWSRFAQSAPSLPSSSAGLAGAPRSAKGVARRASKPAGTGWAAGPGATRAAAAAAVSWRRLSGVTERVLEAESGSLHSLPAGARPCGDALPSPVRDSWQSPATRCAAEAGLHATVARAGDELSDEAAESARGT